MKVDGPGKLRGNAPVKRTGKTDGSAFTRELSETSGTSETSGVAATASVGAVSGIFAAQEVDDAAERESKGKKRAQDMLDRLDDIRHSLLGGDLTAEKLMDLNRLVQSRKVQVDDPKLAQVLDEIDLRAQVELAKFMR